LGRGNREMGSKVADSPFEDKTVKFRNLKKVFKVGLVKINGF